MSDPEEKDSRTEIPLPFVKLAAALLPPGGRVAQCGLAARIAAAAAEVYGSTVEERLERVADEVALLPGGDAVAGEAYAFLYAGQGADIPDEVIEAAWERAKPTVSRLLALNRGAKLLSEAGEPDAACALRQVAEEILASCPASRPTSFEPREVVKAGKLRRLVQEALQETLESAGLAPLSLSEHGALVNDAADVNALSVVAHAANTRWWAEFEHARLNGLPLPGYVVPEMKELREILRQRGVLNA